MATASPELPVKPKQRAKSAAPSATEQAPSLSRLPRRYSRGGWPLAAATAAGTVGLTAAALVGVPEVILGLSVGYATYEIMRHRMGLLKALQAAAKLERDFFRL